MAVWFFYVDESHDRDLFCLSALGIRHSVWRENFVEVRRHREQLKADYGIYLRKEIHAHKLLGGRGEISERVVGKWERSRIFRGLLRLVARLPNVLLFNVCLKKAEHKDPQLAAWDWLTNRIERTLLDMEEREIPRRKALASKIAGDMSENEVAFLRDRIIDYHPKAVLFSDEGREEEIRKILRKMHVYNPIPSKYGQWSPGTRSRNVPLQRIIEDPVFRDSSQSYFVQLADCVAHALLKKETKPTERVRKYAIHEMFEECLEGVCFKPACKKDPLGIVRN